MDEHEAQEAALRLVSLQDGVGFDGPRIVADLRACRRLWRSAYPASSYGPGRTLLALPTGLDLDTLCLLLPARNLPARRRVVGGWGDVEVVEFLDAAAQFVLGGACPEGHTVLRVWWRKEDV
jgi:hypothetical protein